MDECHSLGCCYDTELIHYSGSRCYYSLDGKPDLGTKQAWNRINPEPTRFMLNDF